MTLHQWLAAASTEAFSLEGCALVRCFSSAPFDPWQIAAARSASKSSELLQWFGFILVDVLLLHNWVVQSLTVIEAVS